MSLSSKSLVTVFAVASLGVFAYARHQYQAKAQALSALAGPHLSAVPGEVLTQKAHYLRKDSGSGWTVVEFFDYECPACRKFAQDPQTVAKSIPQGIGYAVRHFPLPMHKLAIPAARLAVAAEERGKLAEIHDVLMQDHSAAESIAKATKVLGLSDAELKSKSVAETVNRDTQLARAMGIDSTPTFVLCRKDGKAWVLEDPSQTSKVMAENRLD